MIIRRDLPGSKNDRPNKACIKVSNECGDRLLQRPRREQPDLTRLCDTKETALNARRKMGSFLTDENESETTDLVGVRQGVRQMRQTPGREPSKPLHLLRESGGSDGARTRSLRRDRPYKSQ